MDRYRFFVERLGAGAAAEMGGEADGGAGGGVSAGVVELGEAEAHHALAVLRLASGAAVEVFDGKGGWGRGVLEVMGKRKARVRVTEQGVEELARTFLTLATAVPKGERADWLIEQASQLGVGAVQWIDCERGVVKPGGLKDERRKTKDARGGDGGGGGGGGKMERWRRAAVEAAKQCGRNWVMEVREMRGLEEVVREALGRGEEVWWMEPREGVSVREALNDDATTKPRRGRRPRRPRRRGKVGRGI